jgi:hypothetical protein
MMNEILISSLKLSEVLDWVSDCVSWGQGKEMHCALIEVYASQSVMLSFQGKVFSPQMMKNFF